MNIITTDQTSKPGGHYSPAVASSNFLFISGQLPVRADGTPTYTETFEVQANQVLQNLDVILKAGGSDRSKLLKVTVYIADVAYWGIFNSLYATFMGDHKPARAIVPVPELHHGYLIEIEAIAEIN